MPLWNLPNFSFVKSSVEIFWSAVEVYESILVHVHITWVGISVKRVDDLKKHSIFGNWLNGSSLFQSFSISCKEIRYDVKTTEKGINHLTIINLMVYSYLILLIEIESLLRKLPWSHETLI